MNHINCCKDCKDRHIGCHSGCNNYIMEKSALDAHNSFRRTEKEQSQNTMTPGKLRNLRKVGKIHER